MRDVETVELELAFADLALVETRLERIEEGKNRGKKPDEAEKKLLLKCRDSLMKEIALRNVEFTKEEMKTMRSLQFLSMIPKVIALNTGEKDGDTEYAKALESSLLNRYPAVNILTLCGKIEMGISQLLDDEREPFLNELVLRSLLQTDLYKHAISFSDSYHSLQWERTRCGPGL